LPADGLRYDTSANLVFAFGKVAVEDVDINSGWNLRLGALGRAYYPINQIVDVGFLGNVSIENEHSQDEAADDDSNAFDFGLMGGVGPVVRLDRAKIAAYAGLRLGLGRSSAGADQEELNRLQFAAPMVNMAAEVQVLDWLYVRTGAEYNWQLDRQATDFEKQRVADGAFRWAAGLGVQTGTFYFDGVVQNGFVTGGPNFIGGNANGFLAMASLTYKFGDVFGSAARPVEAPARPAAAAPPPPPPAPAVEPVLAPAATEYDQELNPPVVEPAPPKPAAPPPAPRVRTRVGASGSGAVNVGTP